VLFHLVEDVVSAVAWGAGADDDSSLCGHGFSVFFVGDGGYKGLDGGLSVKKGGWGAIRRRSALSWCLRRVLRLCGSIRVCRLP
jgi:hypothetical protein